MGKVALLALLLAGCACEPTPIYTPTPLPLPPRPALPALSGEDLQLIPEATYLRMLDREDFLWEYALKLEREIRTTHPKESQ